MAESFIKPATAAKIDEMRARGFATQMVVGTTLDLDLKRDSDDDGTPVPIATQVVLMKMARREPGTVRGAASVYQAADGEFQKQEPFNVQVGDYFRLPPVGDDDRGTPGTITMVLPAEHGIVRALFTLRG